MNVSPIRMWRLCAVMLLLAVAAACGSPGDTAPDDASPAARSTATSRAATATAEASSTAAAGGTASSGATTRPPQAEPPGVGVIVQDGAYTTGSATLDALIAALERHDIDAILAALEPANVSCGAAASFPECDERPDGTTIEVFPALGCGGMSVTERDQVRPMIESLFSSSDRHALYSIEQTPPYSGRAPPGPGTVDRRPRVYILLTPGETPSPFAPPLYWLATTDGVLLGGDRSCEIRTTAGYQAEIANGYGAPNWIVEPRAECVPEEVETTLHIWSNPGHQSEMLGDVVDARGARTDAMEAVRVLRGDELGTQPLQRTPGPASTQWRDGLTAREDVYPGMRVRVEGARLPSCIIDARVVTLLPAAAPSPLPATPAQPAPAVLANNGVSAGNLHSCGIRAGAAYCWGFNLSTQLGNGGQMNSSVPVAVRGLESGVTAMSAGSQHSCAIKEGAAWCWGNGDALQTPGGPPQIVSGFESGVTAIAAGDQHSCAVKDGGAWCWGSNAHGQLGDGTQTTSATPRQVVGMTSGVQAISAGTFVTCALKGGAVWCWGANTQKRSGAEPTYNLTPAIVSGLEGGVSAIAVGVNSFCAIKNGAAICWGATLVGRGEFNYDPAVVAGLEGGISAISIGGGHSCAIKNGGAVCWGSNDYGVLGDGTTATRSTPAPVTGFNSGVTAISAGNNHTCAVKDGMMWCWGGNEYGMLGDGTTTSSTVPVRVQ